MYFFHDRKPYVEDMLKVGRSKTPVLGPLSQYSNAGLCGGIIQLGVSSGTEEVLFFGLFYLCWFPLLFSVVSPGVPLCLLGVVAPLVQPVYVALQHLRVLGSVVLSLIFRIDSPLGFTHF